MNVAGSIFDRLNDNQISELDIPKPSRCVGPERERTGGQIVQLRNRCQFFATGYGDAADKQMGGLR